MGKEAAYWHAEHSTAEQLTAAGPGVLVRSPPWCTERTDGQNHQTSPEQGNI